MMAFQTSRIAIGVQILQRPFLATESDRTKLGLLPGPEPHFFAT